jgi:hypothetical protein
MQIPADALKWIVMPAKAGTQPACVSLATFGLGPILRWGDISGD